MATLKASKQGLAKIKQRRNEIGWPTSHHRWLEEASLVLGINWEEKGYLADGISEGTWSRFLRGQEPINAPAFKAYCQVLGLSWEEVAASIELQDWDGAPDVSVFYGRIEELKKLEQWIVTDHCRLVALLGMGGIGKTVLSVKLAKQIRDEFKYLMWRSLRDAPLIQDLLADLIQFLPSHKKIDLPNTTGARISLLIEHLQKYRCLIIFDNWEMVLEPGHPAGKARQGYEAYSELLKRVGTSEHKSCLLLTSQEKPGEIAALEGSTSLVHSFQIAGLGEAAREILKEKNLSDEDLWDELIKPYRSHPLALKIVATTIQELFEGRVSNFLIYNQNTLFLGDLEQLLSQQFNRLSDLEKRIMYQLSTHQKPVALSLLQESLLPTESRSKLLEILESLRRRSLIEKVNEGSALFFTLQPIIMKYVTRNYPHAN